ncbi:sensor histidine kinase [Mesorhizobium sp. M8A.F.Ca.ET.173.01.1.1]|nr:sensor histidine kinase [Mesorhizobium sp. M8A.F.Ca.ET.173.01.1.1]
MRAMRLVDGTLVHMAWALLVLLPCLLLASAHAGARPGGSIEPPPIYDPQLLSFGSWSYVDRDTPETDIASLDPAAWKPVNRGSPRWPLGTGVRWFRTEFTIGWQYRTRKLGIALGKVSQAHQVYINGHLVGAEGGIGDDFVDAGRKSSVFAIPNNKLWFSFLSFTRPNMLAVRVEAINAPLGLDTAAVQIDDLDRLLLDSRTSDTYVKIAEGGALSVLVLIGLFCSFLILSGFRGRANIAFGFLVLISSLAILADSLLLYDVGWKNAFAQRAAWLLQVAAIAAYVRMVKIELGGATAIWERTVEYGGLGSAALLTLLAPYAAPSMATALTVGMPLLVLFPAVPSCLAAMRRSTPDSAILSFTTFLLLAAGLGAPFLLLSNPPLYPLHLGLLTCAIVLLLPIARQFQEMMRREIALSRRLVNVRDLERARLARDMHDGVGQSLAAVSLQLRMLTRGASNPDMSRLAAAVDDLTGELREVIGNLRPSHLQTLPVGRVIKAHFNRTLSDTGLGFTIGKVEEVSLPLDKKEHLFRIYQEALHNALRHSGCSNLSFSLKRVGRYLRMSISDDGCGFRVTMEKYKGLGLSTMRERSLLINASLTIISNPGEGTAVNIEVPIHD